MAAAPLALALAARAPAWGPATRGGLAEGWRAAWGSGAAGAWRGLRGGAPKGEREGGGARPPAAAEAASGPLAAPGGGGGRGEGRPGGPARGGALFAVGGPLWRLARMDRPMPTWLLLWPCLWSQALATPAGALPDWYLAALFGAGAVLLRGAGCTVNDLWDRDIDPRVERTRTRPLASGEVTPAQAVGFLGAQLGLGLGVLLQLNDYTKVLGASSLALVGTYPLMKRVTFWPQAFLGLTINWGALVGYAAVAGSCDWGVVAPLYLSGAAWTIVYDTIYAHQDMRDDVKAGVKSTALLFAGNTRPILSGFAGLAGAGLAASGVAAGCGAPFFVSAAAAGGHLLWQVWTVDLDSREDCSAKFASNKWYGALVYAGIVADGALSGAPPLS